MNRPDRWNPMVGRKGSKVRKRNLTPGQVACMVLVAVVIAAACLIFFAIPGEAQCCPPVPEPIIREVPVPVIVTETVVVEAELPPCADHRFEVGFQMFGPSPMFAAANLDWRPALGGLNIGKRWLKFDIALGLSGAAIENQPIFGFNAKLGVAFDGPGPYFDVVRVLWFPQWEPASHYEELGLRLPVLVLGVPIGQMSALLYLGAERFVLLSETTGYREANTLLVGATARICRNAFSAGFQTEIRASYQIRDCENRGLVWGLGLNVFLWF